MRALVYLLRNRPPLVKHYQPRRFTIRFRRHRILLRLLYYRGSRHGWYCREGNELVSRGVGGLGEDLEVLDGGGG